MPALDSLRDPQGPILRALGDSLGSPSFSDRWASLDSGPLGSLDNGSWVSLIFLFSPVGPTGPFISQHFLPLPKSAQEGGDTGRDGSGDLRGVDLTMSLTTQESATSADAGQRSVHVMWAAYEPRHAWRPAIAPGPDRVRSSRIVRREL